MADFEDLLKTRLFLAEVSRTVTLVLKTRCPSLKPHDGEDIVQDVMIKILRATKNGTKIENLRSYLWRAAYTTALDVIAEKGRESLIQETADGPEWDRLADVLSAEEVMERKNLRVRIGQLIEELPAPRRRIFKLYLLGLDTKDIAAHLGWSHSKVRHLFYRGIEDLRALSRREKGEQPIMVVRYD